MGVESPIKTGAFGHSSPCMLSYEVDSVQIGKVGWLPWRT